MKWNCTEAKTHAAAYFANQLDRVESKAIESHLAGCQRCRLDFSEGLSAYRLAATVFEAPSTTLGLSEERVDELYRAAVGRPSVTTPVNSEASGTGASWFVAAATLMIAVTVWMADEPAELTAPTQTLAALESTATAPKEVVPIDFMAMHDYPRSSGLIYPPAFREEGGYHPDAKDRTVAINAESVSEELFLAYEPAYGFGRTIIEQHLPSSTTNDYWYFGLGGPRPNV